MRNASTTPSLDADARVALTAAHQLGAFSREQALAAGISPSTVKRRIRSGRWGRPLPGVYTLSGSPPSWLTDIWCAHLAVGPASVVTHESALRLRGLTSVPPRPITLTVAHGRHSRLPGIVVHQIDDLCADRTTRVSGLPVSTAERSIVEVAAVLGPRRLAEVVDEAISRRCTTAGRVASCLREVARPGKPGVAQLGSVLDDWGDGYVPPQSVLERGLFTALERAGLPEPRRQFPLPGRGALTGLVDAAYPSARLIIEADGRRWHARIKQLKRDHQRVTEAARVGWLTLRFVYEEIIDHPAEVAAAVADVLALRSAA